MATEKEKEPCKTMLEEIPYEEFKRLLAQTLEEDKALYDMLAGA